MSIRFKCPSCSKSIKISMAHAGKKGKCPGCNQTLKMPSEEHLQKLMAKQAAAVGAAAPAPVAEPKPSPASDDLFGDLGAGSFDDDDFNFPDPPAAEPEQTYNPYASPLSESTSTSEPRSPGRGYAGFWKRAVAVLIDSFVLAGIGMAFGFVTAMVFSAGGGMPDSVALAVQLVGQSIGVFYYVLTESSVSQATPGKKMMGIKVTDLNGQRISFLHALGRYFARILCVLTLGIGYAMAGFTSKKQGLHDIVAGTLVVNA